MSGSKPERSSSVDITAREREVVHFLAHGFSSRQIAQQLGISFHTVETYRKNLLSKFQSRTTVEMVLKAGNILPPEFWTDKVAPKSMKGKRKTGT
jgi:DNA-binding NarL/FixJ family response regulator